jgi:transcriptional regulator with XRE-family HTH domain
LHRLAEVRRLEGISRKTVARHLGIDVTDVKSAEEGSTDLPLSLLYRWQQILNVPITELLVAPDSSLAKPIMERARLVRLMKTAVAIVEQAEEAKIRRLAQRMVDGLVAIMPELKEVRAWPTIGRRRQSDEWGRAAERIFPDPEPEGTQ